jgi:hypothetical protein
MRPAIPAKWAGPAIARSHRHTFIADNLLKACHSMLKQGIGTIKDGGVQGRWRGRGLSAATQTDF